jgi:hypothetical protein
MISKKFIITTLAEYLNESESLLCVNIKVTDEIIKEI